MFMWVCRAFIISLSIALFVAISAPARALENSKQTQNYTVSVDSVVADLNNVFSDTFITNSSNITNSDNNTPSKTPSSQIRFDLNVSLPPFERQAASAFGSVVQIDPTFVLVYEFLPEILGLKHFLAPLIKSIAVPWYLRPDAANSHGRLAGWKDGNTLYTGTITYHS
jgi:hypothetical protein